MLPSGKISSLFDELMISVSGVPSRMSSGLLVMPGDTMIMFNPLQLDLDLFDAAGISVKTSVSIGQEHGVFKEDKFGKVARFIHKQAEAVLRVEGALDINGDVNVDTGVIWLSGTVTKAIFSLLCENGLVSVERTDKLISPQLRLSFYADFLYPMARDTSLNEYYTQTPEGEFSDELKLCRRAIWDILHKYELSLVKLNPAKYVHFGTTRETFDFFTKDIDNYSNIGWGRLNIYGGNVVSTHGAAIVNSYVGASVKLPICFIEDSEIGNNVVLGGGNVISGVTASGGQIPPNTVLHCLKLNNGKYVCRIYGIDDNPKSSIDGAFLGGSLRRMLAEYKIDKAEVYGAQTSASLWDSKLFQECDSPENALKAALALYKMLSGMASEEEINDWVAAKRHSFASSFNEADVPWIIARQEQLAYMIKTDNFIKDLDAGKSFDQAVRSISVCSVDEIKILKKVAKESHFPLNMRIYLAISELYKRGIVKENGVSWDAFEILAYGMVKQAVVTADIEGFPLILPDFARANESSVCSLPVRVNFCGSPTDAAPYCLEHGGTMLDGAVLLNGKMPITAVAKRINSPGIIFESLDLGARKTFNSISDMMTGNDPYDMFAIHKAVYCSVFSDSVPTAGLYLSTRADVPKGSGLGTSSIMAAACVKALFELIGINAGDDVIYSKVFAAEQLMGTGGGWQDQVGGLAPGLKYFYSDPGLYQRIKIERLNLATKTRDELRRRFVLVFSGQRRLARNILREETNRFIRNDPDALAAADCLRKICALMKFELERGNVSGFASYVTDQFELVKTLDKGASNVCIEYIFDACNDLIDGKSICGAGGGGFLMIILKEGVTVAQLTKRLDSLFSGGGVQVWDSELIV
jgi:fucokinase